MIRDATPTDVSYFCEAAKSYLEMTGDGDYLSFDEDWYSEVFFNMLDSNKFVVLIDEMQNKPISHCAMMLNESMYNGQQLIGKIFSVWGPGGLVLLRAMEERAREDGVDVLIADSHAKLRQDVMAKAYQRQGFSFADQTFLKVL